MLYEAVFLWLFLCDSAPLSSDADTLPMLTRFHITKTHILLGGEFVDTLSLHSL